MTDIVDRLRKWSVFGYGVEASADMKEAADEITKLRAEVAEQVQWVKDLADRLIAEEAKTTTLRAEVARPRFKWKGWINVYRDGQVCSQPYDTREKADAWSATGRIACVEIDIDVEEGHGL